MADFPHDFPTYLAARNFLLALGKVSLQRRPEGILKVADTLKATVINSLNLDEYAAAFERAVSLLSESWPWHTTYNATDFEPIQIVRQYKSLRHIAINLEPRGFVSAWMFGIFESASRKRLLDFLDQRVRHAQHDRERERRGMVHIDKSPPLSDRH